MSAEMQKIPAVGKSEDTCISFLVFAAQHGGST